MGGVATRDAVLGCEFRCRVVRMVVKERFPSNKTRTPHSGRAQEFILTRACREDVRVALLEVVFVVLTLNEGRP